MYSNPLGNHGGQEEEEQQPNTTNIDNFVQFQDDPIMPPLPYNPQLGLTFPQINTDGLWDFNGEGFGSGSGSGSGQGLDSFMNNFNQYQFNEPPPMGFPMNFGTGERVVQQGVIGMPHESSSYEHGYLGGGGGGGSGGYEFQAQPNSQMNHLVPVVYDPRAIAAERKRIRKIKNRESAARSRARQQAYTVQLEWDLQQFRNNNERMKKAIGEVSMECANKGPMRSRSAHF